MSILLSVCIVVYKGYSDVLEAVRSIEKHTDIKLEKKIYVVDNSPNGSEGIEDFKAELKVYNDVEYIYTGKNIGFGKGHNIVLPHLDSKYHAIVNPDIVLREDAFSSIISYMENNKDVGMAIPNITDENGVRQPVYRKDPTVADMFIRMFCKGLFPKRVAAHTLQSEDYTKPFRVPFGQGSFLVIQSDLFKQLNGFDDRFFMYLEDADLCKRVNQVSKLMYYPYATVIHKWEMGSHKSLKLFSYHLKSMRYYFKKWGFKCEGYR